MGISAAVHGVLAFIIAAAPRAPDPQAPPAGWLPAEHVAYMEVGGWPPAEYAVPQSAGAIPARTRPVAPDASPAGASRPAPDAHSPVAPADSAGGADPAPAAVPGVEAAARPAGAGTRTGAARLGPEFGDARLVAPPPSPPRAPADVARYEAQFRAAWRAFADSIQHEADRERLAASWTWKDPGGRAWNVRDGVLFMDGRRIMSMEMSGDRDQGRAARTEAAARREIARQAEDIERDRYVEERRRAIRVRRDQERRGARP